MAARAGRTWLIVVGVVLMVLQTIGVVLWWKLPRWAPVWVAERSPWLEPVLRAAQTAEGADFENVLLHFRHRILIWGPGIGPTLRDCFEHDGPVPRNEVLSLALILANEREWSYFDLIPSSVPLQSGPLRVLRRAVWDDLVIIAEQGITDSDTQNRVLGLELAQSLRDPRLAGILCQQLDKSLGVQDSIEEQLFAALRLVADRSTVPAMLRYFTRTGVKVNEGVLNACLPLIAWEEPFAALTHEDPRLRAWALDRLAAGTEARVLAKIDQPAIDSAVLAAFSDPVSQVRLAAIDAAGEMRLVSAIDPLSRMLCDVQDLTRLGAARALGNIGDRAVVPALLPLLDDIDADVQRATAAALGKLGDVRVAEGLLRLARYDDRLVAVAAVEALAKLPLSDDQRQRAAAADAAIVRSGSQPRRKTSVGSQAAAPERRP